MRSEPDPDTPTNSFENSEAEVQDQKARLVGNYKLLQRIGAGGMGEVWMAQQEKPVRRRVALKLIKSGMDTKDVIARFEAERQAIAMMDHQNIAKVLDAGTTDDGLPYFVMELVHGIPITQYCDSNKLSIPDRLNLFLPICNAIQHAHQKGIIHRDLKPSNILVTLHDGKPIPKVIDFGLAKALQHQTKLTDKTLFTEFGQVVGTIQYMSPEQAEMNALDIDTRTDVYSLGVLLYELLTGSTPIDKDALQRQAIYKVLETIREEDPPRPSTRLSSASNEAACGISEQRRIDVSKLKSILRGELDWIVMKALEKDRTRRYESASRFSQDVENYLDGNVVTARPPSATYKLKKYARRHRALVASLASIAAILILGLIGITWFAIDASIARSVADSKTTEAIAEKQNALRERDRANRNERDAELAKQSAQEQTKQVKLEQQKTARALEQAESTLARSNLYLALSHWRNDRLEDAKNLLNRIPKRFRNIEYHLVQNEFDHSFLTLYGNLSEIQSASISSDNKTVISFDGIDMRVWDIETGESTRTITPGFYVPRFAVSPNTSKMLFANDTDLQLWDFQSGSKLRTFQIPKGPVDALAFSSDGTRIAASLGDHSIKVWDSNSGDLLNTFSAQASPGNSLVFNPDGKNLYTVDPNGNVMRMDLDDSSVRKCAKSVGGNPSIAINFDGTSVAVGDTQGVQVWDLTTKDFPSKFASGSVSVQSEPIYYANADHTRRVTFSPDGTLLASATRNGKIHIMDSNSGQHLFTLKGHIGSVHSLQFSSDGTKLITGGADSTIKIWDVPKVKIKLREYPSMTKAIFTGNGERVISLSFDNTIKLWNAITGEKIRTLVSSNQPITAMNVSPDSKIIASCSSDSLIKLWDLDNGKELKTLAGHTGVINSLVFSSDNQHIVSAGDDTTIKLWNFHSGELVRTFSGHKGSINSIAISSDCSALLSSGKDRKIKLWSTSTGNEQASYDAYALSLDFSPDGTRFISAGYADKFNREPPLTLWDIKSGQVLFKRGEDLADVTSAVFSPDGTRIVSGSLDNKVVIWDSVTGEELHTLTGSLFGINSVAISPDSTKIVAASGDERIESWDANPGPIYNRIVRPRNDPFPYSMTFNSDESLVLAGDNRSAWQTETGEPVAMDDELLTQESSRSERLSKNGRLMLAKSGFDIVIVDLDFYRNPTRRAYIASEMKIDGPQKNIESATK